MQTQTNLNLNLNQSNTSVSNVIGIQSQLQFNKSPYTCINTFLRENKNNSINTYKKYVKNYSDMFMYMLGKNIDASITWEDIVSIVKSRVKDYRQYLCETYGNNSVNQIIFSCKSLWDNLMDEDDKGVISNPFDIEPLKFDEKNWDSLSNKEVLELFEYCERLKYEPMKQRLYFEFLYTIGCRKQVVNTVKWDDIKEQLDKNTGILVWVIKFKDKGKWIEKAISNEFYERLVYLKNFENARKKNDKLIFGLNDRTVTNTLRDYCKSIGIVDRNIVIHSIKKSSGDLVQKVFKDIHVTKNHLQHANINTTSAIYLDKNIKFTEQPSYILGKEYGIEMLRGLGESRLIELIEKCGKEVVMQMCLMVEKGCKLD